MKLKITSIYPIVLTIALCGFTGQLTYGAVNAGNLLTLSQGGGPGSYGAPAGQYPLRLFESWGWNFTLQNHANSGFRIGPSSETNGFKMNYFVVKPGGNVGIGTQGPGAKLQIINTAQNSNGNTLILGPTNASNLRLGYNTSYSWIQSHGSKPLYLNELGNDVIINKAGGKVGIGTDKPSQKFDVRGYNILTDPKAQYNSHLPYTDNAAYVTGKKIVLRGGAPEGWKQRLVVDGINGTVTINGKFGAGSGNSDGTTRGFYLWRLGDPNHVIYSAAYSTSGAKSPAGKAPAVGLWSTAGKHRFRMRTASSQGFLFENNGEKALVDIRADNGDIKTIGTFHSAGSGDNIIAGNVGIGTSKPTEKLAVNGKIRAKEIIVDDSGWSDFVFSEDYELKSLDEVEHYIEKHGHLPDIPAANEVKENGVSLGEMNAKLLQKVEELTLYAIVLQQRIETQQQQIEFLIQSVNKSQ